MGFPLFDVFMDFLERKKTITLKDRIVTEQAKVNVSRFAITMAVNLISSAIAKCEFKTYVNGAEKKSDEYWTWNFSPNDNQSGDAFIRQLVSRLLTSIDGDALVVENAQGKLVVADSFTRKQYAFVPDVFSDVTCANLSLDRTYTSSDVLYFRLENNGIPVLLREVLDSYNNLLNMAYGKYQRLGGRKGIITRNTTASGGKPDQEQIDDLFNNQFRTFFTAENGVISLPRGINYDEKQDQTSKQAVNVVSDIGTLVNDAIFHVARAFQMPPAILSGNIADVGGPTKNFLSFCIDPLVSVLQTEIVRKRYTPAAYQRGTFMRIDTTRIQHINPFDMAEQIDKLLSDGLYSVDELRGKFGEPALNESWSKLHWITKNYRDINAPDETTSGGGETT